MENSIRPVALGRKNYLFAGSHEATRRSGMLYSLLGTCKMHEINPHVWLKDVLGKIATHPINRVEELLPHHWNNSPGFLLTKKNQINNLWFAAGLRRGSLPARDRSYWLS